ncbi:hypothetical protein [Chondrinema litorale]|uniref:hypothetical protein n=1 Tax=Chondrinema litorale TaxID=2994555 RepID=UPI0025432A81|nr:hypothetical protein [Chondrinema litorale]UZR95947.1 hypothetical protein OQ292_08990 [Chondrinema litorale]
MTKNKKSTNIQELTILEIDNLQRGLSFIGEMDIEVSLSYKIGKFAHQCNEILKVSDQQKKKLFEKHGGEEKNGKLTLATSSETYADFMKDMEVLMSQKEKITLPEIKLSSLKNLKIKPVFFDLCDRLIVDDL